MKRFNRKMAEDRKNSGISIIEEIYAKDITILLHDRGVFKTSLNIAADDGVYIFIVRL